MVIRLSTSSADTWRNESTGDAKPAIAPHRCRTVLVKYSTQRLHRELGRIGESIHKKLSLNIQMTNVNRRSQGMRAEEG
jgi:hypothetical protein